VDTARADGKAHPDRDVQRASRRWQHRRLAGAFQPYVAGVILMSLNLSEPMPGWPHPRNPSRERKKPPIPEALRARVVAAGLRGHVAGPALVQSETGRRYRAAVGHLNAGDAITFDLVADPAVGSRLTVAANVALLSE
jgi:hypothetical protein